MAIHFFSENVDFKPTNLKILKTWLKQVIDVENKKPGHINFILCSDDFLLDLNKKYLNHDTLTDIITFQYSDPSEKLVSGDIYISIDRVGENAALYSTSFLQEIHRVIVHGVLHLLGYTDKTKLQKTNMHLKEDYYISLLP